MNITENNQEKTLEQLFKPVFLSCEFDTYKNPIMLALIDYSRSDLCF